MEVNARLEWIEATAHKTFDIFERNNEMPTIERFKNEFNSLSGLEPESGQVSLSIMAGKFLAESSGIAESTIVIRKAAVRNFVQFAGPDTPMSNISEATMESFTKHLCAKGISNASIEVYLSIIRRIMKYASAKGFYDGKAAGYKAKLKGIGMKPVITLTTKEIRRIQSLDLSGDKQLEITRDLFIFCCHTGLRYSDMQALERGNIRDGMISLIEKKTAEKTEIPLSATAKGIIDKYQENHMYAFPRVHAKAYVKHIRTIGKMAGIDTPIQHIEFIGMKRIMNTYPKWQLLGSHTARKTFVTTALSVGVPVTTVMSMSGHNSFNTMKRYIAVADESKAKGIQLLSHALDLAESESNPGNETGNETGNEKHSEASEMRRGQHQIPLQGYRK